MRPDRRFDHTDPSDSAPRRRTVGRTVTVLLAAALSALGLVVAVSAGASGAGAAPGNVAGVTRLTGSLLDFGCANPANRTAHSLLAAARPSTTSATCLGQTVSRNGRGPDVMKGPVGYGPSQIQSAYKLAGTNAAGRTVGIVDAYNDPKAESDLAAYRKAYGLPACTTANGCFAQVNQSGKTSPLPTGDYGWAEEISLDLDAVSSACPSCHILLVEANSPTDANLLAGVDTAVRLGAVSVSNSYGGAESSAQTTEESHLNHPGVAITASSGDDGYGVEFPAASKYVTAVGGTTLNTASNSRGWTESVWSGAGSGCSKYEAKPSWQHDSGCAKRTVADVAADADPNTGLGVYDTYNSCGTSSFCDSLIEAGIAQGLDGWAQVGGTSLSSPLIASVYALAGNSVTSGSYPYAHPGSLFDVTSGSNGNCGGSYLCTGAAGYDGPTGLGTPNGTGSF